MRNTFLPLLLVLPGLGFAQQTREIVPPPIADSARMETPPAVDPALPYIEPNTDLEIEDAGISNSIPDFYKNHPYIRYQQNINEENSAEAYPWISADGLRVYYTKQHVIFMAQRSSRYEDFGKGAQLKLELQDQSSIISCWLSNSELEMMVSGQGSQIWHYKRNSTDQPFAVSKQLKVEEKFSFLAGMSFTPDKKTMLVYHGGDTRELLLMDISPDFSAKLVTRLEADGPGQLSKDGKTIYFPNHHNIYRIPLEQARLKGANPELLLSLKGLSLDKPSLSYDETYLVMTAFPEGADNWDDNELITVDLNNLSFITELKDTQVVRMSPEIMTVIPFTYVPLNKDLAISDASKRTDEVPSASDFISSVRVYPNPSRGVVTVDFKLPVNYEVAEMIILDINMKEIYRKRLSPLQNKEEVSLGQFGLSVGTYMVCIHTEQGSSNYFKLQYLGE